MKEYVYDIEVYPNYTLIGFMSTDGKQVKLYDTSTKFTETQLRAIKRNFKRVVYGFNSKAYDDPILSYILSRKNSKQIYNKSKTLIESEYRYWEIYDKLYIKQQVTSIDLIDVAPGQASLKLYGARLNSQKLQDLPYDPHMELNQEQKDEVKSYNVNDLQLTLDLFNKLRPALKLRKSIGNKYDINVMSKSDAQIAEAIFKHELTDKGVKVQRTKKIPKTIRYKAPKHIKFVRDDLDELVDRIEDTIIEIDKKGSPILPKWLKDTTIQIGNTTYNIGLGGLHSQEKGLVVIPKKGEVLANVDVASYYPSLILKLGLYPRHLTDKFLDVYANIKQTRLDAKRDKSDKSLSEEKRNEAKTIDAVLKITLNGSFGKFGNKYSFLYSPDLLLTITLTGQLYLLMLIEQLELSGYKVVSSNTDGVELVRSDDIISKRGLELIVSKWEDITQMDMEYGTYNALFARDVNNYVAVYPNEAKAKGVYVDPEERVPILEKNVEYPVVFEAIREYPLNDTPMEDTLYNCNDIARFTSSRNVKGGAVWYGGKLNDTNEYIDYINSDKKQNKALEKRNDEYHKDQILQHPDAEYLGRVVRWYYSIDGKPIFYKTGNKVPKTNGAKPIMDLTDHIPKDLDYNKYIELCNEHLKDLGL